ncbi:DUF6268 family outer membrane beta-barrel protein [bacterium]|nr:DUF6268 family outer membrane beta-barrel protein [bacterium]
MIRGSLCFLLCLPLVFVSVCCGVQRETDTRVTGQQVTGGNFTPPVQGGGDLSLSGVYSERLAEPSEIRSRRPPVGLKAEWIADSETGMASTDFNISFPLLFIGTPPPIVKVGVSYTSLQTPESFGIPEDLFEYSVGIASVRKLNERWNVRSILGVELATDNENRSSDAWRFRGGIFATYSKNENVSWTFGAIAMGRQDLPVIPVIGAVWQPNPSVRVDLVYPQPRVNRLLFDDGDRQQWVYLGGGTSGSTWGYQQFDAIDDQLTYSDLRVVLGLESRPAGSSGMPFVRGKTMQLELGYVFSRELEFEQETRQESLGDALMLSFSTKF